MRICVNDRQVGDTQKLDSNSGTFTTTGVAVKPRNTITAQIVSSNNGTNSYSKLSAEVRYGACSAVQKGDTSTQPTLDPLSVDSTSFTGTLPGAKGGETVRICVGDTESATAVVDSSGRFVAKIRDSNLPLKADSNVTSQ